MKLISCTDFVLEQEKKGMQNTDRPLRFERILKYAKFLKQPLTLSMFVPCDDEGNVLEEITFVDQVHIYLNYEEKKDYSKRCLEYQQAKERVIFEGCGIFDNWCLHLENGYLLCKTEDINKYTIEDIVCHNLTITPNAVKNYQL